MAKRRFRESQVNRWPARTPGSRGGEFAPKGVSGPRWAMALVGRMTGQAATATAARPGRAKATPPKKRVRAGGRPASGGGKRPDPYAGAYAIGRERGLTAQMKILLAPLSDRTASPAAVAETLREAARGQRVAKSDQTTMRRMADYLDPGGGRAAEPDLFDEAERSFRSERTRPARRERYEQGQLLDTSVGRQLEGQQSMLDELGNIDLPASSGGSDQSTGTGPFAYPPGSEGWNLRYQAGLSTGMEPREARAYAGSGLTFDQFKAGEKGSPASERVNPRDIKAGDTIIMRRRDYDRRGRLGPEDVTEHKVARVEAVQNSKTTTIYRFYDSADNIIRGGSQNSKIEIRRGVAEPDPLGLERFLGTTADPAPDVARMEAYESATRLLDTSRVSDRGREFAMRKLGGLTLGVSAKDVASTLREGIGRSGHTKADNDILTTMADMLERGHRAPPRVDPDAEPPGWVEPPRPDSTRDPQELFDQAVAFAQAMNDMESSPGVGRFRVLPSLEALNGLTSGAPPAEVVKQLEAEAQTHPAEWAGGREYLNRLAGFLRLQSTTMPKAEADAQRERRKRFDRLAEGVLGADPWRMSTTSGSETYTQVAHRFQTGKPLGDILEYLRNSAESLERRASSGQIQDYDISGVLAYDPDSRKRMGLSDAKRLLRLANELEAQADEDNRLRGGAVVMTPADRKAVVAKHDKMTRAEFDALPEMQRAQILDELRLIAESGDKARARRDSMGSLVRGVDADHVIKARSLISVFSRPTEPTRDQRFNETVARLKSGQQDRIPITYSRAELVALDEALGLGESTMGRPTQDKLRIRMQAALDRRRGLTGDPVIDDAIKKLKSRGDTVAVLAGDSRLTSAKLKKLAAAMGVDVPEDMRAKTALQMHIAEKLALREKRGQLVEVSRQRQAAIDEAKKYGGLAAEVEELINNDVSDQALASRVLARVREAGLEQELADAIDDARRGDRAGLRRKLAAVLMRRGVELRGQAGDTVKLDRKRYQPLDDSLPDGADVEIVRPAYRITLPDGEVIVIRGKAESLGQVGPDSTLLKEVQDAKTLVALRQMARARGTRIPGYLKKKEEIREHLLREWRARPGEDREAYSTRTMVKPGKVEESSGTGNFTRARAEEGDVVEWRENGETKARGVVRIVQAGKQKRVFVEWDGGRREQILTGQKYSDIHVVEGRTTRDRRAIDRVMERDSPAGIVAQLKETGLRSDAEKLLRGLIPHRLALVAQKARVTVNDSDDMDTLRERILKKFYGPAPAGAVRQRLLGLAGNPAAQRSYLASLGLTRAQANALAKALGAQQTRIDADATLDNIVKHFRDAGGGDRPFRR